MGVRGRGMALMFVDCLVAREGGGSQWPKDKFVYLQSRSDFGLVTGIEYRYRVTVQRNGTE